MKVILLFAVVVLACLASTSARDLVVGSSYNAKLINTNKVQYRSIPWMKRVKEYFFSDPKQQIIKGIVCRDIGHTDAAAAITAGGIGFNYVNIKMKSERGGGLNYYIQIYA